MPVQQANESAPGLEQANRILEETASALAQGRTPRAGRHLLLTIRQLLDADQTVPAAHGYRLLAQLELRRGKTPKALRPARAAERLLRSHPGPEADACIELLSRVYSEVGDHERAVSMAKHWLARATSGREPLRLCAAIRRLALAEWVRGDICGAFDALDQVLQGDSPTGNPSVAFHRIELLAGNLLTRVGCPRAATELFTRILKQELPPEVELCALLGRGWAGVCSGNLDAALRSFRRGRKVAAGLATDRAQTEAAAALAAAEYLRQAGGEVTQLAARLRRRSRQAAKMGLASLAAVTETLADTPPPFLHPTQEPVVLPSASPDPILQASTPKDAARQLVSLAHSSESLTLVDGCCLEVEYLQALRPDQKPFPLAHWLPALSLE